MALHTVLSEAEIATAVAAFGRPAPQRVLPEPRGAVNTNHHVWAGGARWFLRVAEGKRDADLRFEAEVLAYLGEARFPALHPIPAADGSAFARVAGKQATLFAYAAGEECRRAAITPARCRRVGEQLARLHELSAGFPAERPNPHGPAYVRDLVEKLRPDGAGDAEVRAALPVLEDELARAVALPGAPRGLVHGDLFPENVLWIGDRVSTVLDWEMSCVEAFAFDLGVALCAWCYADRFDPERARALVAGYRARRRVEPETLSALYPWTRFAALRFAASRIHGFRLSALGADRLAPKDWRRFRDRLGALREMGEAGFERLVSG